MTKVQVLMSTYNGEKYIAAQIESILNQTHLNLHILIRDDGSTDATKAIICSFAEQYPNRIKLIEAENAGVISSFLQLLDASDTNADYYCFSDQDDYWYEKKVERALQQMQEKNTPLLHCTSTNMTDDHLSSIGLWPSPWAKPPSFYNALLQNIAVGTTITLNKRARDLLVSRKADATLLLMHDWWAYLVVSAFGEVFFDPEPSILYRQHDHNVIGGNKSLLHKLKKKWGSFRKHSHNKLLVDQAQHFDQLYGVLLSEEKKEQLKLFIEPRDTLWERLLYLNKCKLYRQSSMEQQIFKLFILIGYI